MAILLPLASFLFLNNDTVNLDSTAHIKDQWGMFIPLGSVLLVLLANHYIRKDDQLVKSMDRLRWTRMGSHLYFPSLYGYLTFALMNQDFSFSGYRCFRQGDFRNRKDEKAVYIFWYERKRVSCKAYIFLDDGPAAFYVHKPGSPADFFPGHNKKQNDLNWPFWEANRR